MLKRLQQRLYRLIVPDSALTGWQSFAEPLPPRFYGSILRMSILFFDDSTALLYKDGEST